MIAERAIEPRELLSYKPVGIDGITGYGIFADVAFFTCEPGQSDERFICAIVPAEGHSIEDAADHVIRALGWLDAHPEDPRVAKVDPPVDRIFYRERRALLAVKETHDAKSRILVSKLKPCLVDLSSGEQVDHWIETLDTKSEAQSLDEREAWIAKHGYDEDEDDDDDEGAVGAHEAENSDERAPHGSALEGAAQ